MCAVLPGHRHVRGGEVRSPGVLPLLHQDAGAVRAEVLRRLPGAARQGAASPSPLLSSPLLQQREHRPHTHTSYTRGTTASPPLPSH